MSLVRVAARVKRQALDTASPHAPPTPAAPEAGAAAHGILLLEGVAFRGEARSGELLVIAGIEAVHRLSALHRVAGAVAALDDGAPSLAGVPLLGEAAGLGALLDVLLVVEVVRLAAVERGDVVILCVFVLVRLLHVLLQVRVGGAV